VWIDVCGLADLEPEAGVCALVDGRQVAIICHGEKVFAIDNFDPFARAYVISRGIVGDKCGVPMIASPIYKNAFDLRTGQSLDDPSLRLTVWPVRVRAGRVEIGALKASDQPSAESHAPAASARAPVMGKP
jgi:nitrite reductase (NADH) small subunit